MSTFWQQLPRPFFVLAPMEDVTDTVFRRIVASCAVPDVFFSEFCSVDGLVSRGRERVAHRLAFTAGEQPIVVQLWGLEPKNYYTVAKELSQKGFAGIDINMGCPKHDVVGKGACAALIKNPKLAAEIIQATKEGAGTLPVSVKTRLGYTKVAIDEWLGFLLEQDLAALIIHGRTAAEMSVVPAHWDEIGKAVELRNHLQKSTVIIGNGDVRSRAEGEALAHKYGVDGIMIGRGIFENPWVFAAQAEDHSVEERLAKFLEHIDLFETYWQQKKNFLILRKFVKTYVNGFTGASDMRVRFMQAKSLSELKTLTRTVLAQGPSLKI